MYVQFIVFERQLVDETNWDYENLNNPEHTVYTHHRHVDNIGRGLPLPTYFAADSFPRTPDFNQIGWSI